MTLDAEPCYRALVARDGRFDGVFFVAVRTTGVYCRPVCRARTPALDRCIFYRTAAEAEREGFRACFRCRPELAPGKGLEGALPRLVEGAVARIEAGYLNERSVDELALELGVTGRHLRRAMEAELGLSPVELAQSRRLAMAKQLLQDTAMPLAEVAFASGFSSVRRFNALFQQRFGRAPSSLRRGRAPIDAPDALVLRLDYRPPLDWDALLAFLAARAIPGLEQVTGGEYHRVVRLGGASGRVVVRHDAAQRSLRAELSSSLAPALLPISARLRALFDLDAQPAVIADQLGRDAALRDLLRRHPGLRVPGAFDGFELAVRAVLGQQVSVRAATTLSGRLVERFGPPAPERLAAATEDEIAALGMPGARARTLLALARAAVGGALGLDGLADREATLAALRALPGIGEWTASYIAMRALRSPDAFPAGDLGLRKALGGVTAREAEARAAPWRPWRAYAAMHLWQSLTEGAQP